MTTIIDLNDLSHSINRALTLGRYQIVVKTAGAEQVPASITLDLLERDDDEYGWSAAEKYEPAVHEQMRQTKGVEQRYAQALHGLHLFAHASGAAPGDDVIEWFVRQHDKRRSFSPLFTFSTDDHGAAIPEQGSLTREPIEGEPENGFRTFTPGPMVYEYAMQDTEFYKRHKGRPGFAPKVENQLLEHAPDLALASAADWVHVYDRVTRERRTLKRPEPDAVLNGLRNVAADLREKSSGWSVGDRAKCIVACAVAKHEVGKFYTVTDVDKAGGFLGFDGNGACWLMSRFEKWDAALSMGDDAMHRAAVEAGYASLDGYVEAKTPAADPMPPVGPLTSTEGLKAGDVVKANCGVGFVKSIYSDGSMHYAIPGEKGDHPTEDGEPISFVARPGVWMPWEGGENPVPGMHVHLQWVNGDRDDYPTHADSVRWDWQFEGKSGGDITAYMVVDTPSASSDT